MSNKERLEFCQILLSEAAPDELDFLAEYYKAVTNIRTGERLGPEFGIIDTTVLIGPVVVLVGQRIFDLILSWTGELAQKTVEDFIVDQGKDKLKGWLTKPERSDISMALTSKGKSEILAVVSYLATEAELPPEEVAQIIKHVAGIMFGDNTGQ